MKLQLFIVPALFGLGLHCRVVDRAPLPAITPAPRISPRQLERALIMARDVDPISLAEVLLTAIPASLRQIAATNPLAASSILWSEFLDDKRPSWFTALPTDIQTYLVSEFSPTTATSNSPSSSSAHPSSVSSGASLASATATVTSFATVTSSPDINGAVNSGLSSADKAIIGLAVALAFFIVAVLILAFCLVKRMRRRPQEQHIVESRPPTPAFLASTMVPRPKISPRESVSSVPLRNEHDGYEDPFADPPPVAAAGAQHKRNSRRSSSGSLTMVPEEPHENEYGDLGALPPRNPRRMTRNSMVDPDEQFMTTAAALGHDKGRYPTFESNDWHNQHPALRNNRDSGPYSTPYAPVENGAPKIARKPVAAATNGVAGGFGNHARVTTQSPPRRSDWPFVGDTSNGNGRRSYWKVQKPNYDRYEQVENGY